MGIFEGLFDDAALFPPGNLPLAEAIPAHRAHRQSWYSALVGPFVCPADRAGAVPLPVSLILRDGPESLPQVQRQARELRAVEMPVPGGMNPTDAARALEKHLPDNVPGYLELPWDDLDALAGTRIRAKFRTGPAPSDTALAGAIRDAVDRDLAFKCTAGLHHAIRAGQQHGFLNILLATDAALQGANRADLAALLAERSAEQVVHLVDQVTAAGRWDAARAVFTSFGTCSIVEPIADLVALGLLGGGAR
ncbi:hypothetical protein [Actinoplanes sp. NPDC051851]|uniref:hypothetical protein n=1 Tax=Actinoplanes sp. NPDC051851 TaxID=3154753 RepID=UPI00342D2698